MASKARATWNAAKKQAGQALDDVKLKDDFGPTMDAVDSLAKKLESQVTAVHKTLAELEKLAIKLRGIAEGYNTKLNQAMAKNSDNLIIVRKLNVLRKLLPKVAQLPLEGMKACSSTLQSGAVVSDRIVDRLDPAN